MAGCKSYILEELKPIIAMVVCQILNGGAGLLYKLAIVDGMKIKILVFYRLVFATAFIAPLALVIERNKRPKLTWRIILQGFLSGLLGATLSANLFGESLRLTSPTFAAAMTNLIPAVTFIMAIIFRLEGLSIKTSAGKAKIVGTLLSVTGAMVLTFFKGIKITSSLTHVNLVHQHGVARPKNQVLGSILALFSCLTYASWLIVQAGIRYPCYSSIALMCFMGSIQTGIYAFCTDNKDWSTWKLAWDIRLLTATYSVLPVTEGIIISGMTAVVMASCTIIKGPLFVSSFFPLGPLFVAVAGSLFFGEMLSLGSIIGTFLIIFGLYVVLWGKGKELKADHALLASETRNENFEVALAVGIQATATPAFHVQNSDNRDNKESSANEGHKDS